MLEPGWNLGQGRPRPEVLLVPSFSDMFRYDYYIVCLGRDHAVAFGYRLNTIPELPSMECNRRLTSFLHAMRGGRRYKKRGRTRGASKGFAIGRHIEASRYGVPADGRGSWWKIAVVRELFAVGAEHYNQSEREIWWRKLLPHVSTGSTRSMLQAVSIIPGAPRDGRQCDVLCR